MYSIKIPDYHESFIGARFFLFEHEQEAIDSLTEILVAKGIEFKIRQTRDRIVFINFEKGELASIVAVRSTTPENHSK